MEKPIPAFYACYLLRSTVRHASLYVGSTPNPVRRLKQHNGEARGGAAKTSKDSLRPWEMTCLVTGFPSQVAALQFEWAWQNSHLTRHISPSSRLAQISPKTGRLRRRPGRLRQSLADRLLNLRQLLVSSSFVRWPLRLTFYVEDVYKVWQKCNGQTQQLALNIAVDMDASSRTTTSSSVLDAELTGIHALDVSYVGMRPHLEKSKSVLAATAPCAICHRSLTADETKVLVCSKDECGAAGHLQCFASRFLGGSENELVPIRGHCPNCTTELRWVDLVRELSLRIRGEARLAEIFKPKRIRGVKRQDQSGNSPTMLDSVQDESGESNEDEIMNDEWHVLSGSSDDD